MTKPQLTYLQKESPFQNLTRIFRIFKFLQYKIELTTVGGERICRMLSLWGDQSEFRKGLVEFEENFYAALVSFSMSEEMPDYSTYLRKLDVELQAMNAHLSYPAQRFKIMTKKESDIDEMRNQFKDIERHFFTIANDNQGDIRIFFKNLQEGIHREKQEWGRRSYVRTHSSYGWTGNKNEFSELALGLFVSGDLKRTDSEKLKASTFARELAAFFGIDKLNFDQDIELISNRQKRIPGKVFDKFKVQLQKDFEDRRKVKKK